MKIHTETVTLPAHYASALINGDYSGCTDSEEKEINDFIADNPQFGACLSCSDYPELTFYENLLMDCLQCTFPVNFYRTADNGLHYVVYPAQTKTAYMPWQLAGLTYTASGYGKRIPTSKMVLLLGVWRRVYRRIFSNSGTCWVNFQGKQVIVDSLF